MNTDKKSLTKTEANAITRECRIELIKNNPVTTARYFENRCRCLIAYMYNPYAGRIINSVF